MTERAAYLALARSPNRKRIYEVLAETGSALATWRHLGPLRRDPMAELLQAERGPDRILTPEDGEYPTGLRHLREPPLALYLRGQPLPQGHLSVAIVGSRGASPYGLAVAERFGRELARAGVSVVSGLARGIDTAAHRGAIRSPESCPVAVLGCGLDHDYPVENRGLKLRLEKHGTVVSEYPPSDPPEPWRFPIRNRIIAGLSRLVLIVEAAARSGALITARWALDLGRPVLVVPGDIGSPTSQGSLMLLREGATPVGTVEHVLEELEFSPEAYVPEPLPPSQQQVLEALAPRGSSPDELVLATRLTIPQILSALGQLQVQGRVMRVGALFLPL